MWTHIDPVTGSRGDAEFNADGVNVGFNEPTESAPDLRDAKFISVGGNQGCYAGSPNCVRCFIDGLESDCGRVAHLLDVGAAKPCPDNDCGPKPTTSSERPKTPPQLVPFNDPRHPYRPFDPNIEQPIHSLDATDLLRVLKTLIPSPQNPAPMRLQSAIDLARVALTRDSCKKLFAGFIDPVKLLDDLASGNKGIGSIKQASLSPPSNNAETTGILGSRTVTNAQGQQIRQSAFTGANITINSNSAAAFQAGYGGRFGVSDEINRAITLIHELGHAANIVFGQYSAGILNDEGGGVGKIASDMNSERVFKECFEMSPSTYGGGQ